jgi:hypothetical protein
MTEASLRICHRRRLYKSEQPITLSRSIDHSLPLHTHTLSLSHPTMASNDNNRKCKVEEEVESSVVRKRLQLSDDDSNDDSSSESEEETEEEESMNQLDTSEEKLMPKCGHNIFFGDDGDTSLSESEPRSLGMPSNHVCSNPNDSDDDEDDFWM